MSTVYLKANNPIGPLRDLSFQYTPIVEYSHDVKYDAYQLTHTNYQPNAYARSENPSINLTAKFSAHTKDHFKSSEYALRFLRTYTKMNYGRPDEQKGQPPRILRFFAYGAAVFNNVPVVISKFNMTFPDDVDYIRGVYHTNGKLTAEFETSLMSAAEDVPNPAGLGLASPRDPSQPSNTETNSDLMQQTPIYLPAIFTVNISLMVQQNTYQTVTTFDLKKFSRAELYNVGYI